MNSSWAPANLLSLLVSTVSSQRATLLPYSRSPIELKTGAIIAIVDIAAIATIQAIAAIAAR